MICDSSLHQLFVALLGNCVVQHKAKSSATLTVQVHGHALLSFILCFPWLSVALIEPGSRGFPLIPNKEPNGISWSLRVPKLLHYRCPVSCMLPNCKRLAFSEQQILKISTLFLFPPVYIISVHSYMCNCKPLITLSLKPCITLFCMWPWLRSPPRVQCVNFLVFFVFLSPETFYNKTKKNISNQ